MLKIKLEFDKTINMLAGNAYGQQIYNEQVKDKIDLSQKNIIIFPGQIEDIAISFVQGFSAEILKRLNKNTFFDYITIQANERVKDKFTKSIFF